MPSRGHAPPGLTAWPGPVDLAVIGPMARSAEDSLCSTSSPARTKPSNGRGYRLALPPARRDTLSEFRVLIVAEHPLLPTSAAIAASLERLSAQLVGAGAAVKRETSLLPDLAASSRLYMSS